jgi:hypothetical protein
VTYPLQVRGPLGIVVELTAYEHDVFCNGTNGEHKVYRKKCTFLPGINAEWDAKVKAAELRAQQRVEREQAAVSAARAEREQAAVLAARAERERLGLYVQSAEHRAKAHEQS